ncbi:MAG TPA: PepSY domain-containing protein [Nitrospira sp.]|nr:PepSY domain-containing protein [Nitrospira sp.]
MSINHRLPIVFMFLLLGVAGTLTGTGAAYSDKKRSTGNVEMAVGAKVTIEQEAKTASEKVSGRVIKAEFWKKQSKLMWEVEIITAEKKVIKVHIDADTGDVIGVEEARETPRKSQKRSYKLSVRNASAEYHAAS